MQCRIEGIPRFYLILFSTHTSPASFIHLCLPFHLFSPPCYEYESQYEANTLLLRLPFHNGSEWFCAKNKTVISTLISWAVFELGVFVYDLFSFRRLTFAWINELVTSLQCQRWTRSNVRNLQNNLFHSDRSEMAYEGIQYITYIFS